MTTEKDAAALHLRDHLTDGVWHDGCGYCQRRRVHGGTGVEHDTPPGEFQQATAESFASMTPAQRRAALVTPRKRGLRFPSGQGSPP